MKITRNEFTHIMKNYQRDWNEYCDRCDECGIDFEARLKMFKDYVPAAKTVDFIFNSIGLTESEIVMFEGYLFNEDDSIPIEWTIDSDGDADVTRFTTDVGEFYDRYIPSECKC